MNFQCSSMAEIVPQSENSDISKTQSNPNTLDMSMESVAKKEQFEFKSAKCKSGISFGFQVGGLTIGLVFCVCMTWYILLCAKTALFMIAICAWFYECLALVVQSLKGIRMRALSSTT